MFATTSNGDVRGAVADGVSQFLGIPYGEPPVGALRFAAPVPRSPWSGVFDATVHGPRPPQPAMVTVFDSGADLGPMDEDCLRVNIYTPSVDGRRPVMVWFHGGGLAFGSANEYDGSNLARGNDVVVVTVGFRLGLLGFADLGPCGSEFMGSASNGFRDQILALEWVRTNISAFGGDPGNVTVFGQSGGGLSILALLGAPSADGLFHRAIVLSAGPPQPEPPEVVSILGGTLDVEPADLPQRLRELTVERIIDLQQGIGFTAGGSVDGTVVTRFPVDAILHHGAHGVPIVIGTTRDEGTLLTSMMAGLRPAVLRIIAEGLARGTFEGADPGSYLARLGAIVDDDTELHTRVWTDHFRRTATRVAEAACEAGPGGWLYRFDLEPTGALAGELGVTHAADLGFVFDTLRPSGGPDLYDTTLPGVHVVADRWSATLASFARHGHPNEYQPEWHQHLPNRTCLIVSYDDRVEHDLDRDLQQAWGDR
ncbi:MAG: carboxylesterase family protein [Acidimicrobiales bacterium]